MRELVHEPINTRSTEISVIAIPGRKPMYCRARSADFCSVASAYTVGSGTRLSYRRDLSGVGTPRNLWSDIGGLKDTCVIIGRIRICGQMLPASNRSIECFTVRREWSTAQVLVGGRVWRNHPCPAPASMVILQTVIRSSMLIARITLPVYSMTHPVPPLVLS